MLTLGCVKAILLAFEVCDIRMHRCPMKSPFSLHYNLCDALVSLFQATLKIPPRIH